jgi:N-glycosylase/DNA lyase
VEEQTATTSHTGSGVGSVTAAAVVAADWTSTFSATRARAIGAALAQLNPALYEAIDRDDPGWPVLEQLVRLTAPYDVLTMLVLTLSDFQASVGGSASYWSAAQCELARRRANITSPEALRDLVATIVVRLPMRKMERVERLLRSSLPAWIGTRSAREIGQQPMELWTRLARAMNQAPDAKTIVAAMKGLDLMVKIETGQYAPFPETVPLLVDLRIARMSLASGLMGSFAPTDRELLMRRIDLYIEEERVAILDAWNVVSVGAGKLSLFRIDGLLWQVAEDVHRLRRHPRSAADAVTAKLAGYGAPPDTAALVAAELTAGLLDP